MKPSFLIVGLGNPGKKYEKTRHNAGWIALDLLSEKLKAGEWKEMPKFQCTAAEADFDGTSVLLVKPTTFMNLSGACVRSLVDFYKVDPGKQIVVLTDDVDIPLGTFRLRTSGGPGTHNGLKSLVETFGEDFPRLRLGLGPQPENFDLADWVLAAFSAAEQKQLLSAIEAGWNEAKKLISAE